MAQTAGKAAAAKPVALPTVLKEIEDKYVKQSTVSADFEEINVSFLTKQSKKSFGKIEFKRPGKIYWQTVKPMPNLLVSDGALFWFYTPPFDADEKGQYWEKKTSQVQSKFAQALLAGNFSQSVAKHSMTFQQKSKTEFAIYPKKGTAGNVTNAVLRVDPERKLIVGIDLNYTDGNKASINLTGIALGVSLPDSRFHFNPPPHTEKLEQ